MQRICGIKRINCVWSEKAKDLYFDRQSRGEKTTDNVFCCVFDSPTAICCDSKLLGLWSKSCIMESFGECSSQQQPSLSVLLDFGRKLHHLSWSTSSQYRTEFFGADRRAFSMSWGDIPYMGRLVFFNGNAFYTYFVFLEFWNFRMIQIYYFIFC